MQNSNYKPITTEEFSDILKVLGLYNEEDNTSNAQILCHGPGKRGIKNLDNIITKDGLRIIRNFEDSNNYVASGVLSTNTLMNSETDNSIDIDGTLSYTYGFLDKDGNTYNIISAIPQKIQDIVLGRVMGDRKDGICCVLDELNIDRIPPQFILGVMRTNTISRKQEFLLNDNFYAISRENELSAVSFIQDLLKANNFASIDEYYKQIEDIMRANQEFRNRGLPCASLRKYKEDAYELYKDSLQGNHKTSDSGSTQGNLETHTQSNEAEQTGDIWVTSTNPETAARLSDKTQKELDALFKQEQEDDFVERAFNYLYEKNPEDFESWKQSQIDKEEQTGGIWVTSTNPETAVRFSDKTQKELDSLYEQKQEDDFVERAFEYLSKTGQITINPNDSNPQDELPPEQ